MEFHNTGPAEPAEMAAMRIKPKRPAARSNTTERTASVFRPGASRATYHALMTSPPVDPRKNALKKWPTNTRAIVRGQVRAIL